MTDIKRILVPVDLERHTRKLVDFAIDMANNLDAEIILFHGIETGEDGVPVEMGRMALSGVSGEELQSAHTDEAGKRLEEIAGEIEGKCKKCESTIATGDVVDEIVEFAEKQKADLIIIGSHGRRGLEHILLGSVAERVIKRSPCPTLIMNPYR